MEEEVLKKFKLLSSVTFVLFLLSTLTVYATDDMMELENRGASKKSSGKRSTREQRVKKKERVVVDEDASIAERVKLHPRYRMVEEPLDNKKHGIRAKESFLEKQRKLIEGKKLTFWGIGLFAGTEIFSKAIRTLTHSNWSHNSMILVDEQGKRYCFQSTGKADDVLKGIFPQVQISEWDEEVDLYEGNVAHRQFAFEPEHAPDANFITAFVHTHLGASYEQDMFELLGALFDFNKKEHSKTLFCSELVAYMLQEAGYLTKDHLIASNVVPREFSSEDQTQDDKKKIQFLNVTVKDDVIVKKEIEHGDEIEIHTIQEILGLDHEIISTTVVTKKNEKKGCCVIQ